MHKQMLLKPIQRPSLVCVSRRNVAVLLNVGMFVATAAMLMYSVALMQGIREVVVQTKTVGLDPADGKVCDCHC